MDVRAETQADISAIDAVITAAFRGKSFSSGREAASLATLREDGDLTLSLVRVDAAGAVVGCIAFSPVFIDGASDGYFGLGPVAVRPDLQGRGLGRALIERGLSDLKDMGARGCALIGRPALYGRFGFFSDGGLRYRDVPPEYVQARVFAGEFPQGELRFSPGLE